MSTREQPTQRIHIAMAKLARFMTRAETRTKLLGDSGRDLTPIDVELLRTIVANGPMRASELSDWQAVDKSTITLQVRRLVQRELVARQTDPTDRRAALLTATTQGLRTCRRMDSAGVELLEAVVGTWPKRDQVIFASLFSRFVDDLSAGPTE
jgi:DNA-binding MarR family transcriptional regulator